jgi:predicted amidophosphoribosyltransferase
MATQQCPTCGEWVDDAAAEFCPACGEAIDPEAAR